MRLYHKSWRNLLMCLVCLVVYILTRSFLSQEKVSRHNTDIVKANITITILGQDDGSRRKKVNAMKKKSTMTCNIPKLEMNGSDAAHFFHEPEKLICKEGRNWVYIDANKKVQLIEERKEADCKVQQIVFKQEVQYYDFLSEYYDYFASFFQSEKETWGDLKLGEELPSEMANVKCTHGAFFPDTWEFPLLSLRKVAKETKKSEKKKQWNVLMISFDSVSHMTFRRNLPKTLTFLEEKLEAVVLNGYNIVGDGTPGAFIPILTGSTEEELPLTRKRFSNASFVDDVYPFIWKDFSDAGYVTLFGEDQSRLAIFDFRLKGFNRPPTDHFLKPYFKNLEIGLGNVYNARCVGSDMQHKHWLRYAREFVEAYPETPTFGLLHHCVYSHDDINLISIMDEDLTSWLRSMSEDGLFDDTILMVMADHGARFAKIRDTHQGQMEERLPFFSVTLPKKLRATEEGKMMYTNLKVNKERLSSPFDIHKTLHDILEFPNEITKEQDPSQGRSMSLLRPIPASRNCEQAGIAPHWCTCLDWKDALSTEEDKQISTQVADAVVQAFNKQLQNEFKICSPLKLKGIEYAKKLLPNENVLKFKTAGFDGFAPEFSANTKAAHAHYQIKLATTPGRGVYEVTVLYDFLSRHLTLDLASVSHVSRYGDDPHCIIDRNYFLATYCVCYDQI